MMKWQAVFFDFDGVILDSVDVKTRAFARMFRGYGPEVERQVVDYHLAHGGVSRYEKFRYYYEQLLHRELTEARLAELGDEFAGLVVEEVLKAPFLTGAVETLEFLKKKGVPTFVVSGTPHEEVQHIVSMRNLDRFFLEVHGAPRKKDQILRELADKHGFTLARCLFIGDAMTDYNAAVDTGTQFLGIVAEEDTSPFPPDTTVSHRVTWKM